MKVSVGADFEPAYTSVKACNIMPKKHLMIITSFRPMDYALHWLSSVELTLEVLCRTDSTVSLSVPRSC
jgi:hypothetical protein